MKFFTLILFLGASFHLFAQEDVEVYTSQSEYDSIRSTYIKSYPDHFFLWPVLVEHGSFSPSRLCFAACSGHDKFF